MWNAGWFIKASDTRIHIADVSANINGNLFIILPAEQFPRRGMVDCPQSICVKAQLFDQAIVLLIMDEEAITVCWIIC